MTHLIRTIVRLLFVPILLLALAVLLKGYSEPGDGFAAGVIASLAILLQHVSFGREEVEREIPLKAAFWMVYAGLLLAVGVAFLPLLAGEPVLTHFPRPGAEVIRLGSVELHTALLFDVGVFLLVFGFTVGVLDEIAQQEDRTQDEDGDGEGSK
jgi:multisubunit Na+/H+ antiporter MnhB subunit